MKMKKLLTIMLLISSTVAFSETISEIQGDKLVTNYENKKVSEVKGVVTLLRKTKFNDGFFMQTLTPDKDNRTSEAIYVENVAKTDIKVGDLVEVEGTAKELYFAKPNPNDQTMTSIEGSSVKVIQSNLQVEPIIYDGSNIPRKVHNGNKEVLNVEENALDYIESLEGMKIKIVKPLITGFNEKYGNITVVPSLGKYAETRSINGGVVYNNYVYEQTQRITLDTKVWNLVENGKFKDGLSPNPGDVFNGDIEGVVYYEHGEYKLVPTSPFPGITDNNTKPEVNKFKYDKKMLNVVSYNVENLSHFDNPERIPILAKQVKTVLQTPDILGLIEVGDDNGGETKPHDYSVVSAKENIKQIIDAIKKETGISYGYMSVDPEHAKDGGWPEMHIRNVILYRKDRLKPVKFNQGDSKTDTKVVRNKNGQVSLTFNPGRIGNNEEIWNEVRKPVIAQFKFRGKNIFVIANHLKSKRADSKIYGAIQPVERKSENVRIPEGEYVNNFVKEILKADKNATVISLGDMNDFEFHQLLKK